MNRLERFHTSNQAPCEETLVISDYYHFWVSPNLPHSIGSLNREHYFLLLDIQRYPQLPFLLLNDLILLMIIIVYIHYNALL